MKSRSPSARVDDVPKAFVVVCLLLATLQVVSLPIVVFIILPLLLDASKVNTQGTMHASNLRATFAAGLAVVSRAQQDRDNDAAVDISSCSDLDTVELSAEKVCKGDQMRATGVGIAANVFAVNETSLSLTLVDDGQEGGISSGYQLSTQSLYYGVSSDVDVSEQPPACALMLQYQGQTFPNITGESDNTTSCSDTFSRACLDTFTEAIRAFELAGGNSSASSGVSETRCDLLASHVRAYLLPDVSFCGLWSSFLNVTGGPIFGPDASTTSVELQESGGDAVSPEDYELHEAVKMTQLFRPGGDEFPDADADGNEELQSPIRGAGRQGSTPVVGVFYRSEEDTMPEVEYACMRTFTPEGETLPNQLNYPESSAGVKGVEYAAVMVVAATFLHMLS